MDEVQVRVGDDERRAVDERLQQAVGDGRLTLHEYEERAGSVWAARTRAELSATTADLPDTAPAPAARPDVRGRPARTRRALAVMSGDRLSGPVAPGQDIEAYAVMGGACIDLRRDDLPAHVHVRAVAVMGGVEVLVPRGVHVQLSGVAFMGGRDVHVDAALPGAPVVDVQAYALMGGVEVKHGEGASATVSATASRHGAVSLEKHVAPVRGSQVVRPGRPRHRHGLRNKVVAAVVVVAAAFGLSGVVGADEAAVFSSGVVHVQPGESKDVGMLFGSETVVVPNNATVESGGTVIFGSTDCDACSNSGATGNDVVHIRSRGAFGSVSIVTEAAYASHGDD